MSKSITLQTSRTGFTLVELLVVIAIVAILAAVVILIVNPLELMRRGRDVARIKDLDNIAQAINVSLQEATSSVRLILCSESDLYPCTGSSHIGTRVTNGSGWIKANLTSQTSVTLATLPIDPLNNNDYHYTYCADNDTWEINTVLESEKEGYRTAADGGNEWERYEVGSSYLLIASDQGSCVY